MMKMGFKVGSGLGKDGEGRKEPVPINEVKTDKKGIGKAIKEKSDKEFIKNNIMKRQKSNYIFITKYIRLLHIWLKAICWLKRIGVDTLENFLPD